MSPSEPSPSARDASSEAETKAVPKGRIAPTIRSTILVVDDEARNRQLIAEALSPSYEILQADSGQAALDLLARARIDLVLLDVLMPGMGGLETCQRIREGTSDGFLPIILLTALASQEHRNQGLAAGADEFLTKPIDLRELSLRVRGLLRIREQDERIRQQVLQLQQKELVIGEQIEQVQHLQNLKDNLFALIVHDLRNPLAGVAGYLELLKERPTVDPVAATLRDKAALAAKKLQDLLEEVLEVQRLESGALPVRLEPCSLSAIAHDAVATVEGAARARRIAIAIDCTDDPATTLDRALVRRSIENLLSNAIKFSPQGEVVTVRIRAQAGPRVEVADRGPGVTDSTKLRLFEKFASLEARRSGDRRRGFGLGLHLVKLVAETHHGTVFVKDHEGGGAIFGFTLGAAAQEPEPPLFPR